MSEEKILSRIHKMMALANNAAATEGERENAMRMAHNLLVKHNLSMADVASAGADQEPREKQEAVFTVYPWARSIAHSIAKLFFCEYFFQRAVNGKMAHHSFIGKQSNAITAAGMADYVVRSVFKELRKNYGSETAPSSRAFATGVADALRHRVGKMIAEAAQQADAAPGTAVVLANLYTTEAERNKAWIAENVGALVAGKDRTKDVGGAAYKGGVQYGKGVSLNTQVGTAASKTAKRLS